MRVTKASLGLSVISFCQEEVCLNKGNQGKDMCSQRSAAGCLMGNSEHGGCIVEMPGEGSELSTASGCFGNNDGACGIVNALHGGLGIVVGRLGLEDTSLLV